MPLGAAPSTPGRWPGVMHAGTQIKDSALDKEPDSAHAEREVFKEVNMKLLVLSVLL